MTKRVTIADIAERAGLSKGAVSYALNGQPGVSEATRQRVLRMALEMGWHPNSAAKALSGARAGAFGLVMARSPAATLGIEPFFMKLISGMEGAMAASQTALLLQVVSDHDVEIATYRRWWAERRVDGVFLLDLRCDDKRVPVLEELKLPAMVVGGPGHHGSLPGVWIDDAGAMVVVIEYLAALRHRRIARVAGVPGMLHTELRTRAFNEVTTRIGIEATTVSTDYTPDEGAQATRRLLSAACPPTAIVYDNDVMAVAGVSVAHEMGVDVPGELSIMAWDDSVLCEIVHPPLTAVRRDITAYGTHLAEHLLALLDGQEVSDFENAPPRLVVRGSTARPTVGA